MIYAQVAQDATLPMPDTDDRGSFSIERGCLVLTTASGKRYAPVLPAGSTLPAPGAARPSLLIGGARVALGRPYGVTGGQGSYGPPPPPACPDDQFLVGGVR